ncbi:heme exporter protein CcmD [Oceanibacterium hippocampi]|uniref:heme exporter protein CcmD n=1 Tax=Oceanibacterium hippocampi TaxID=745714 RepID=UPI000A26EA66|nr:heme exporter protein CcmD [Oceanibacterium hippocampi]
MAEFFHMGGYAAYVWPAFAITAAVLVTLLLQSRARLRRDERLLEQLEADHGPRRRRRSGGGTEEARDSQA